MSKLNADGLLSFNEIIGLQASSEKWLTEALVLSPVAVVKDSQSRLYCVVEGPGIIAARFFKCTFSSVWWVLVPLLNFAKFSIIKTLLLVRSWNKLETTWPHFKHRLWFVKYVKLIDINECDIWRGLTN